VGWSTFPLVAHTQTPKAAASGTLIADLEKQIPLLMKDATLPGLSAAIIKDAQ
jgi:hypothetical protein